jgi:hypothetical protein|uniref:Uncharacterized protein n=1 Tax=Sphingomonas sp. NS2 TaxID=908605 RepID=A0A0D4ZYC7_9SPHN|nr:hypothetical protein plasmid201_074 [Sphingomonas sp. NS2]
MEFAHSPKSIREHHLEHCVVETNIESAMASFLTVRRLGIHPGSSTARFQALGSALR